MAAQDTSFVPDSGPTVHMDNLVFAQPSIAIARGERVTLVADTYAPHTIANGTWSGDGPRPASEPGAPATMIEIAGRVRGQIGPFAEAGDFLFYCTLHKGMNLAVTVR